MTLLGAVLGALTAAGALCIVIGLRPAPAEAPIGPASIHRRRRRPRPGRWWPRTPREKALGMLGLVVGLVLALTGGWVVAIVLVPVIAVGMPRLLSAPGGVDPDRLEAMEEWVRALTGVLHAEMPLRTAITATLPSAPATIRPEVQTLVARLQARRPLADALYGFAEDLDDQTGDYIAAALIQASTVSNAGLTRTLPAIATEVANEVRVRRAIGVERARAVNQARWVAGVAVAGMALFVLLTPFGAAYHTPMGQIVLLGLAAVFAAVLLWMRRRATTTPPARFLLVPAQREGAAR